MNLPSFGSKRVLEQAAKAASEGRFDDASERLREYFSLRFFGGLRTTMKGADADAAMLAATCAILRGDDAELAGVGRLVEVGDHASTENARKWIELLRAAMAGDVRTVFAQQETLAIPALAPLLPSVLLIAAERGMSKLTLQDAALLGRSFSGSTTSSEVRARVALVVAAALLRHDKRKEAVDALAAVADDAPILHRSVAALARGDFDAAAELAGGLGAEDRPAVAAFAARLAVGADASSIERSLQVVGPFASAGHRAALVAALATALSREGAAPRAIQVLDVERQRSPGSGPLAMATAYAALVANNPALATEALRKAPVGETSAIALRLMALAAKGDHEALLRELDGAEALSPAMRAAIQPAVLATLMTGGVTLSPEATPDWLSLRPESPEGLYAWAVLKLRHGASADALRGFETALGLEPSLAEKGDAPDAARIAVARDALREGRLDECDALARSVISERHSNSARRLLALSTLRRLAAERSLTLDATSFATIVESLHQGLPEGERRDLLGLLSAEAKTIRARSLLRSGKPEEARPILDRQIHAAWTGETAYLAAIALLLQGAPPAELEPFLASTIAKDPTNLKNQVLFSEVRGAIHGPEARLETLEPLRAEATASGILQEALAAAYGGAHRGLEAKKVGLAEVRRLRGNVPTALAEQVREALALEFPSRDEGRRREAAIVRRPPGSLLPRDAIGNRIDLLLARASAFASARPDAKRELDPLLDRTKRSVLAGDFEDAAVAELELIELLGRIQS